MKQALRQHWDKGLDRPDISPLLKMKNISVICRRWLLPFQNTGQSW